MESVPTEPPYQSPNYISQDTCLAACPLENSTRVVCITGFWITIIHALFLVYLLAFIPYDGSPNIWRADSWQLFIAIAIWEHPWPTIAFTIVADAIAAYGFYCGRRGHSPWRAFAIYTAVRLFGVAVAFSSAAYLFSLHWVELPMDSNLSDASTSYFYGNRIFGKATLREALLSIPLGVIFIAAVAHRLSRRKTPVNFFMQRSYLITVFAVSTLIAIFTWVAFYIIGSPQAQVANYINQRGGYVRYDYEIDHIGAGYSEGELARDNPFVPAGLITNAFHDVVIVFLGGKQVKSTDIDALRSMEKLKIVVVPNSMSEKDLELLKLELPNCEFIWDSFHR
jgi:hypothetical protein